MDSWNPKYPKMPGTQKRFGNIERTDLTCPYSTARLGSIGPACTRKHLKQLGLLGCGGFGAVELVEHAAWQYVRGDDGPIQDFTGIKFSGWLPQCRTRVRSDQVEAAQDASCNVTVALSVGHWLRCRLARRMPLRHSALT